MSHYAHVVRGIVDNIIAADANFIATLPEDDGIWLRTSYNTSGGKHLLGGVPFRKNYAGIGFSYNVELDAFIPPQPYPSWILNTETCLWEPPVPMNTALGEQRWDENTQAWVPWEVTGVI